MRSSMKNDPFFTLLKILVLLAPIPFGCVGRIFSPLFYILILVLSLVGLSRHRDHVDIYFLYEKKIRVVFLVCLGFLALQILPLPFFLLKIVSPATARYLTLLNEKVPAFHSISMVPFETLVYAFKFLVLVLFFWVMMQIKIEKKEIISIFKVLVLSAVLQTILGFLKYFHGNRRFFLFFHEVDQQDPVVRYLTGTLGNPNHFAFYLEMILPLVLAIFFLKLQFLEPGRSLRERFVSAMDKNRDLPGYFAIPVLLGVGIILTGSRAGIITMIFSFIIFAQFSFYLKQSRRIRKKLKFILIGITVVALFLGIQDTVNKFMSTGFESSGRFLRWPATITMARDYPVFGAGFGTYRYTYFLYDMDEGGAWSTHAHNDYLETAAEGGIIGSLLLFFLIGTIIYSIVKMWADRDHPGIKILGVGILTSLFAAVFHSFFDFSLHIPVNLWVFVLVLALGIRLTTYKRNFRERE
ncbi:MAG: O-antigen ligase family protein [Candidatus Aminicenantes bacterium]|nr:MAG: O-antigen ligase family protein [Candidatus Aminicenantes bacterium]